MFLLYRFQSDMLAVTSFHVRLARIGPKGWRNSMKNIVKKVKHFLVSEDGPTAVEYAVMLALIIIVCLAAITAIGQNADKTFQNVANQIGSTGGTSS